MLTQHFHGVSCEHATERVGAFCDLCLRVDSAKVDSLSWPGTDLVGQSDIENLPGPAAALTM